MRQNFLAQLAQLLKCWLCNGQSGTVMEENWALSFDQHQLLALQLSVHLIDLLSRLYRCNGFTGIQKVAVDQTGSRPPNSDHDPLWGQVWLWEVLWSFFSVQSLSWALLVVMYNPLVLQPTIRLRNGSLLHTIREETLQNNNFLICCQLMRNPLIEFFHLSNFLQMPNDHIELSTLSSSEASPVVVRISFDGCSQWVTVNF